MGVKRSFDYRVKSSSRIYIDDYAHHPWRTESNYCIGKGRCIPVKITGIFSRICSAAHAILRKVCQKFSNARWVHSAWNLSGTRKTDRRRNLMAAWHGEDWKQETAHEAGVLDEINMQPREVILTMGSRRHWYARWTTWKIITAQTNWSCYMWEHLKKLIINEY